MRIESVTAHAFGPLAEATLELGRGMTVIQGPNESGKSTWHAALYAGLCGIRRARGRSAEIAEFRERHRPWDGNEWKVSMYVSLADGRRVQLSHDLEGRWIARPSTPTWAGTTATKSCSREHRTAPSGWVWTASRS